MIVHQPMNMDSQAIGAGVAVEAVMLGIPESTLEKSRVHAFSDLPTDEARAAYEAGTADDPVDGDSADAFG